MLCEDYLNKFQTLISEASYTNLCAIVLWTSNSDPEPDCDSVGWEASLCNMSGKAFTFYLAENRAIVTAYTLFYHMTAILISMKWEASSFTDNDHSSHNWHRCYHCPTGWQNAHSARYYWQSSHRTVGERRVQSQDGRQFKFGLEVRPSVHALLSQHLKYPIEMNLCC